MRLKNIAGEIFRVEGVKLEADEVSQELSDELGNALLKEFKGILELTNEETTPGREEPVAQTTVIPKPKGRVKKSKK